MGRIAEEGVWPSGTWPFLGSTAADMDRFIVVVLGASEVSSSCREGVGELLGCCMAQGVECTYPANGEGDQGVKQMDKPAEKAV